MKSPSRLTLLRAYEWILRVEINRAAREARNSARLRRCGAKRKRDGNPCTAKPLANGRCKFHGGKSTGPRTPEGLERIRRAVTKHGFYSEAARLERRQVCEMRRLVMANIAQLNELLGVPE